MAMISGPDPRKDQERDDKIAALQRSVDEGLESGVGSRSKDELFEAAIARFGRKDGN